MSLRHLSIHSDACCSMCGDPAAEGFVVDGAIFCTAHGQMTVWIRTEERLYEFCRTFGRRDDVEELVEGVVGHAIAPWQSPSFGYVVGSAS